MYLFLTSLLFMSHLFIYLLLIYLFPSRLQGMSDAVQQERHYSKTVNLNDGIAYKYKFLHDYNTVQGC